MRKGYGQFCPVAKAAEVLAERWTPLVMRELLEELVGGQRLIGTVVGTGFATGENERDGGDGDEKRAKPVKRK